MLSKTAKKERERERGGRGRENCGQVPETTVIKHKTTTKKKNLPVRQFVSMF